ncbi:ribosome rescue GTPase HflX [Marinicella gelatinilytica]|uniref:ribosome rescue GTPase HflX n=1 Tax=Marinicella gelatinilytica TaxID=2996017 RepID=UPI002260E4F7|nr:ribosome rescue GTPase HflX [Marinicella gelatinilytica]MCX7545714.1 GTPase HflX [Marinicella gelatinilytica]
MFERSKRGDRAILLCPAPMEYERRSDHEEHMAEFKELAVSAGAEVLEVLVSTRQNVESKYYVGSGKAEELADLVKQHEADLVLVDAPLSPVQERNLERLVQARVLDRRTLILDIFSQRARSYEGQLQVELAQLKHMSTRLVRGWTHLERQKGGIGMRGPGETQLETDRRLLNARVKSLNAKLEKVMRQREQGRRQRKKSGTQMMALVGYTNAGKSTLFNILTDSKVYAKDQLFATLDPTVRQFTGIPGSQAVISDTVGFVRDLPHELVAAFRATLQEAMDADVLIHVIDDANPEHREHMKEVYQVLRELEIENVPIIEVYNKIDLSGKQPQWVEGGETVPDKVWLSSKSGAGVDLLLKVIEERIHSTHVSLRFTLPMTEARLRAQFYELDAVNEEHIDDGGNWCLTVELPLAKWHQMAKTGEGADAAFVADLLKQHDLEQDDTNQNW